MEIILVIIFIVGYAAIALEHNININKAASALLAAVILWSILALFGPFPFHEVNEKLFHNLSEASAILFFLLGAMTIVELIDAHDGFDVITKRITTTKKRNLLWVISFLTFFLSAALDNLTTAIVMASLLRKLIKFRKERIFFTSMVIIAANAGGAWSPIGDVTTTMLWIGGQITAGNIIVRLILPSLIAMIVPLIMMSRIFKGEIYKVKVKLGTESTTPVHERNLVFYLGLAALLFVPIFKAVTHLPPHMGILFGLGVLWIATELIHKRKNDEAKKLYSVAHALKKVDVSSVLFFLGILSAIGALEVVGVLDHLAGFLNSSIGDLNIIALLIGLLSAIVDNVPMVAAAMGMYSLELYPQDHVFWELMAYCAGTGGSILIIGSAAGVAVMGIEKIDFGWYLKRISVMALVGYLAGALTYIALEHFFKQIAF